MRTRGDYHGRHTALRRGPWAAAVAAVAGSLALLLAVVGLASGNGTSWLSLRLSTQSDLEWYRAAFTSSLPASVPAGAVLKVPVTVRNLGALTWEPNGESPVRLGYHWLLPDGRVAVFEGVRTRLPYPVPRGGAARLHAVVRTPPWSGRFRFVWDMVEEGVTWFASRTGQVQSTNVVVRGGTSPASLKPSEGLASAPQEPERSALWSVALRMIAAHPLIGVGPDGFRLAYGEYARPRLKTWDRRIFANSLPLELAADLGVVGAFLFFAFIAAAIWPLLRDQSRRTRFSPPRPSSLWDAALLAAVAAILAHGLIDYLLGAHAVAMLLFVLLGLIGARATREPAD